MALAPKVLEEKEVLKSYYIRSVASDDPRSLQYQGLNYPGRKLYALPCIDRNINRN